MLYFWKTVSDKPLNNMLNIQALVYYKYEKSVSEKNDKVNIKMMRKGEIQ